MRYDFNSLEEALKKCWCQETCYYPAGWSKDNPAWGQCAITALLAQDIFGGEIVWAKAIEPDGKEVSHFFNLINGEEVDMTRSQFPDGTSIPKGEIITKGYASVREYILSNARTAERYRILRHNFEKLHDKN